MDADALTQRNRDRTRAQLLLSRVVIVGILIITALPAGFRDPTSTPWQVRPRDAVANVLLYFPFGFFQPQSTLLAVAGTAAGISGTIEVSQLFFVRRHSQPADFIANTLGAMLGFIAARFLKSKVDRLGLEPIVGFAAIGIGTVWTAMYYLVSNQTPPFIARGTIAAVSFLFAAGLHAILNPRSLPARVAAALAGGGIAGVILLPAVRSSPLFTLTVALVFGCALIFSTARIRERTDL